MRFLINTFNHHESTKHTLDDPLRTITATLRALGHTVGWSESGFLDQKDGLNIIVEGFTPDTAQVMRDYYAKDCRFLLLATEEPTEKGFNHGIDPLMVERQAMLLEMKGLFEGVLHLIPGGHCSAWYEQIAPAAHVELGWAPGLERFTNQQPDHAFGFYGGGIYQGSRRYKILQTLGRKTPHKKAVKVIANYAANTEERDREMRRAAVLLQIRLNDKMGLVSNSLCSTALLIGRPVIAEPHALSWPWEEVIHFSKTMDGFYAAALSALPLWRGIHASQFAKFKRLFTPDYCLGAPLRRIGLDRERLAA